MLLLQDKEKLEVTKYNEPPKPEAVKDMIKYARNIIEEFRRAKHYKNILYPVEWSWVVIC